MANNSFDMSGKIALVTGGATGIGASIVDSLAQSGATVIVTDVNVAAGEAKVAELKEKGLPWEKAKAFDGAAVIGNWLPKSEFNDINNVSFSLIKNDGIVQQGNTSLMLWKIDELIEYVSKYFTLKIGDIIFTGTPSGVGKVDTNDTLKGYIEDKQLFSIIVK